MPTPPQLLLAVAFKWESYLVLEAWNSTEFVSSLWIKKKKYSFNFQLRALYLEYILSFFNFFLLFRMDLFFFLP